MKSTKKKKIIIITLTIASMLRIDLANSSRRRATCLGDAGPSAPPPPPPSPTAAAAAAAAAMVVVVVVVAVAGAVGDGDVGVSGGAWARRRSINSLASISGCGNRTGSVRGGWWFGLYKILFGLSAFVHESRLFFAHPPCV